MINKLISKSQVRVLNCDNCQSEDEDKYKNCEDFCPIYRAIEEYNQNPNHKERLTCSAFDCDKIVEVVKKNREGVNK